MLNVNIEEVKKHNESLKQYKEQASKLSVEIDISEKELASLCQQLTQELGVGVTKDNIEQIYNEQVEKINQALTSGKAILSKIEQEMSGVGTSTPVAPAMTSAPVPPVTPVMQTTQASTVQGIPPMPGYNATSAFVQPVVESGQQAFFKI